MEAGNNRDVALLRASIPPVSTLNVHSYHKIKTSVLSDTRKSDDSTLGNFLFRMFPSTCGENSEGYCAFCD